MIRTKGSLDSVSRAIVDVRRAWVLVAAAVLVLVGCSAPATALAAPTEQDLTHASEHFQRGKAAFADKRYREAASAFGQAFQIVPDAGTAFNAALAWESAKDPARAADAYVQAIETGGLDGPRSADAKRALAEIEAELSRVVVRTTAPARVTIAYRDEPAPLIVHLAPGGYAVVATFADGSRASRTIDVERAPIVVNLTPPVTQTGSPVVPPPVKPGESSDPGAIRRVIGVVSLGLGAAGGATAIALGVLGMDARDEFDATGRREQALHDDAIALRIGTNVAWGIAGAFTVTGIVLVATSFGGEEPPATAALRVGPTRLALCGSF